MARSAGAQSRNPARWSGSGRTKNRALLEVSRRTIRIMLEYKCKWYGTKLVVVAPGHTSGGRCSEPHQPLAIVCADCGTMFDADVNAAKNILTIAISPTKGLPGIGLRKQIRSERHRASGRSLRRPPCISATWRARAGAWRDG